MRYANIVTVQGDDYSEAERAAEAGHANGASSGTREWVDALFAHLRQWDQGEATEDDVFGDGPELHSIAHPSDCNAALYAADGTALPSVDPSPHYVLTWDTRLGIASLYRVTSPEA